jgi:hypothetical protein
MDISDVDVGHTNPVLVPKLEPPVFHNLSRGESHSCQIQGRCKGETSENEMVWLYRGPGPWRRTMTMDVRRDLLRPEVATAP